MGKQSPEYFVWAKMIARCHNPRHPNYKYYGARGITVCDRWRKSFADFLADIGQRPGGKAPSGRALYSIDRIDNNGPYSPENVRWATSVEQQLNRRITREHSVWAWKARRCQCDGCREAARAYDKIFNDRKPRKTSRPGRKPHGAPGYKRGCKCEICLTEGRAYSRLNNARVAARRREIHLRQLTPTRGRGAL